MKINSYKHYLRVSSLSHRIIPTNDKNKNKKD